MYIAIQIPRKQIYQDLIQLDPMLIPPDLNQVQVGRDFLAQLEEKLCTFFKEGYAIQNLLAYHTFYIDQLLKSLYQHFNLDKITDLALIAVGGYGRAELFLKSDVDILIVSKQPLSSESEEKISSFISFLWDLKLDIGSSVRTIEETLKNSNEDLTIRTNLLENRFLFGNQQVYGELIQTIEKDSTWNTNRFFHAKVAEELERHHSYKDTAYALEPDLKHNPGGIRDIQVMQWIANFHFQAKTPEDMLSLKFLSQEEYEELIECRDVLYQVRYALHITIRREDNRLTLDNQAAVACLLGYTDEGNLKVENMMRDLYRCLRRIRELNSITLQLEVLRITGHLGDDEPVFLNNDFIKRGPLIDVIDEDLFLNNKTKILEIFLLMARYQKVVGIHVHCLRLLRHARRALSNYLTEIPECRKIFKSILDNPEIAFIVLPLMHEHHLLSAYTKLWESIEGLSQFDMFHTYTVDEHTVRVIKNIDLIRKSNDKAHSLFKHIYQQLSNPEILIVAALMHDIAKGQGGHHSQLGAGVALSFCQQHGYPLYQTRLISWLVYNHLLMSNTALRRDINDPQVVNDFSKLVQDEEHLNLLYCLSVADISATNDHEWNSWKDTMFSQLYFSTRQALRHGLEKPHDIKLHASENQQLALSFLRDLDENEIRQYWATFKPNYFIYYTPYELAWHTRNILTFNNQNSPLILFAQHPGTGTEVLIHCKYKKTVFNFCSVASVMASKRLNVQSAQIIINKHNDTICTLKFQNQKGDIIDNDRLQSIRLAIIEGLRKPPTLVESEKPNTKIFKIPTVVTFLADTYKECSNLEISTLDQPGLLAKIGYAFTSLGFLVRSARITTTGERADDFFSVTDKQARPLSDRQKEKLKRSILEVLGESKPDKNKLLNFLRS